MITEELKIALQAKHGELNFNGLVELMENNNIEYINSTLKGPMGISTYSGVYLDYFTIVKYYNDMVLFYIILHETGHMKRIHRMGKNKLITVLSNTDYDSFFDYVISEEIFADRYAMFLYQKLNNESFNIEATQQLHLKPNQERYHPFVKLLFGKIDGTEESYDKLFEKFIVT